MKARKITLGIAALALVLPAAIATAASSASAGSVPPVNIDTSGIPPLCPRVTLYCSTLNTVDETVSNTHSANYAGQYHAVLNSFNDSSNPVPPGACADGPSTAQTQHVCRFTFHGGNPKVLCTATAAHPVIWYQAPPGQDAWTLYPNGSDSSVHIGGSQLIAEGGGVADDTGITTTPDGTTVVYRVHIQVQSLCGNEDTVQNLFADVPGADGPGGVALDALKGNYNFVGYFDLG